MSVYLVYIIDHMRPHISGSVYLVYTICLDTIPLLFATLTFGVKLVG